MVCGEVSGTGIKHHMGNSYPMSQCLDEGPSQLLIKLPAMHKCIDLLCLNTLEETNDDSRAWVPVIHVGDIPEMGKKCHLFSFFVMHFK